MMLGEASNIGKLDHRLTVSMHGRVSETVQNVVRMWLTSAKQKGKGTTFIHAYRNVWGLRLELDRGLVPCLSPTWQSAYVGASRI